MYIYISMNNIMNKSSEKWLEKWLIITTTLFKPWDALKKVHDLNEIIWSLNQVNLSETDLEKIRTIRIMINALLNNNVKLEIWKQSEFILLLLRTWEHIDNILNNKYSVQKMLKTSQKQFQLSEKFASELRQYIWADTWKYIIYGVNEIYFINFDENLHHLLSYFFLESLFNYSLQSCWKWEPKEREYYSTDNYTWISIIKFENYCNEIEFEIINKYQNIMKCEFINKINAKYCVFKKRYIVSTDQKDTQYQQLASIFQYE